MNEAWQKLIVLLAKVKLNIIEILISRISIGSYIKHDESVSVKNVLKDYDVMKEAIKNLKTSTIHQRF